jgi:hypothetical protein
MNTSSEAIKTLQEAHTKVAAASAIIENLIAAHDYQDVALLVAHAGAKLVEAATLLMQSNDAAAFTALEDADDLLDAVYNIIDADLGEDE